MKSHCWLSSIICCVGLLFSQQSWSQNPTPLSIDLEPVYTAFSNPVGVYNCGDNRLFVVEQLQGDIEIIDTSGTYIGKFLDLTSLILTGSERGLLGLAFHPNYINNGYFFVNYTNLAGNTVVARYTVSANPNVANSASALILTTISQPYSNHNGGNIEFGPDGYLYIGMGDGGSGGDPDNYSQNPQSKLGKMLRIDVDNGFPYGIPPSNPFFGQTDTLPEIWALGLRNPWKFSFDALTGDMWIGDVGQNLWEEIDMEPANSAGGSNWGWRCYEGLHTYNTTGCSGNAFYDFPLKEFSHSGAYGFCSITGGRVYRGSEYPGMQGNYFFADYCASNIYTLFPNGIGGYVETIVHPGVGFGSVAFGEDSDLGMYLCNIGGTVYKIKDDCGAFMPIISSDGNGSLEATPGGTEYWWWNNDQLVTSTGTDPSYSPAETGLWYATVSNATGCIRQSNSLLWLISTGIPGCTYPDAINYNVNAETDDGSCIFPVPGCMDVLAYNFDPAANVDDGSCVYGIAGCMEQFACNYDPQAAYNDCSLCDFASCHGCTEPCAVNYDPEATIDDGSCQPCAGCTGDLNFDSVVNISDLLLFIAEFGTFCD